MDQVTEGTAPDDFFLDRNTLAFNRRLRQSEGRLTIATGHALENLEACREGPTHDRVGPWVQGVLPGEVHGISRRAEGCHECVVEFVELIEHGFCTFVPDQSRPRSFATLTDFVQRKSPDFSSRARHQKPQTSDDVPKDLRFPPRTQLINVHCVQPNVRSLPFPRLAN